MTSDPVPARIRPAHVADAEAVAAVHAQAWRETYSGSVPDDVFAEMERTGPDGWRRALADPGGMATWLAERSGEVVGLAQAHAVGPGNVRPLQLSVLYVLRAHQGTGTGQRLLDVAVGDAPCFLWVAEDNPRAIAFYRRNGFEPDGAREIEERWGGVAGVRLVR
ncbi:GNAT family N-acetyltransferase [Georgenia wangjunii]|uniref:GNAT family N-acetyltransferase n=1 Tax=Georgenia wangjunii TaxID=3117730 RepID=UPI002F26022B